MWDAYATARRRALLGAEGKAPLGISILRIESAVDRPWKDGRYQADAMSQISERVAVLPLRVLLRLIRDAGDTGTRINQPPLGEHLNSGEIRHRRGIRKPRPKPIWRDDPKTWPGGDPSK